MIGNDLDLYLRTNLGGLVEVRIGLALLFVVSSLMRLEESLDVGELRLMDEVLLVVAVAALLVAVAVAAASPLLATIDWLKHTCLNSWLWWWNAVDGSEVNVVEVGCEPITVCDVTVAVAPEVAVVWDDVESTIPGAVVGDVLVVGAAAAAVAEAGDEAVAILYPGCCCCCCECCPFVEVIF